MYIIKRRKILCLDILLTRPLQYPVGNTPLVTVFFLVAPRGNARTHLSGDFAPELKGSAIVPLTIILIEIAYLLLSQ